TIDIADAGDETPVSQRFRSCSFLGRSPPATAGRVRQSALVLTSRIMVRYPQRDILLPIARVPAPAKLGPTGARRFGQRSMCLLAQDQHAPARVIHPVEPMPGPRRV